MPPKLPKHKYHVSFEDVINLTSDADGTYEFLCKEGLFSDSQVCSSCGNNMSKNQRPKVSSQGGNYINFRCYKCKTTVSATKGSIFYQKNLPLSQILKMIYFFTINVQVTLASKQLNVSKTTISKYNILYKLICSALYHEEKIFDHKIGGKGSTVEVDETHLYKRKYFRGRVLKSESVWLVGGICRETNQSFVKMTTCRNAETLETILRANILPDTTLMTDGWRGYVNMGNYFDHSTVNHSISFVNPEDRNVHTQKIERFWRSVKEGIRYNTKQCDKMANIEAFMLYENDGQKVPVEQRFLYFLRKLARFDC